MGEGFRAVSVSKKYRFRRSRESGQVAFKEQKQPEERFRKTPVSVKKPASCKRKAEPHKYLCGFRETRSRVNGPLVLQPFAMICARKGTLVGSNTTGCHCWDDVLINVLLSGLILN